MTVITGIGPPAPPRPVVLRRTQGAFRLPDPAPPETASAAPVAPVAIPLLLAMQEAGAGEVRDREARRHAGAMLAALAALQRALLENAHGGASGTAGPAALEHLARLVRAAPTPDDPRLAAVQQALLLRCAIELARPRPE